MALETPFDTGRRTLLGAAALVTLGSMTALAATKPKPRVIHVVARKFVFVPNEIRVKAGETVALHFTAPEVPMGNKAVPVDSAKAWTAIGPTSTNCNNSPPTCTTNTATSPNNSAT